jgi:hypothetical protein
MKIIRRYISGILLAMVLVTSPVNLPFINYEQVQAAAVKLNKSKVTLQVGENYNLKLNGTSKTVKWSSDNEDVVIVSTKGKIIGIEAGNATVTAKLGAKKYNCLVTVHNSSKLTAEQVYNKCSKATVQINTDNAIGSGFFIEKNKIITNYHVIDGASTISVQLQNGNSIDVDQILGFNKDLDIAILSVSKSNNYLKINNHGIKIGETVYAIGSSLGFTDTFTNGIITNAKRVIDDVNYIQTNAAITNGNSGGPLLNAYGEVMGINTMYAEGGQNLNFAINISQIKGINTDNPMTVSEYYSSLYPDGNSNNNSNPEENYEDYQTLNEDTANSGNISTCQTVTPGYLMYGSIGPYTIDYYRFNLASSADFLLAGTTSSGYDLELDYIYFALYNSKDELITVATPKITENGIILGIDRTLQADTYYIEIISDPDYINFDVPYIFTIAY